jgi:lysophospholipase L1-like esterase
MGAWSRIARIVLAALVLVTTVVGLPMISPAASATAAQTWSYVALGDSLAFGALALPFHGYTFQYRAAVVNDTGNGVFLSNLGVPGWTSSDLLRGLRSSFVLRPIVRISQVVTFSAGGNDLNPARSKYKTGACGGTDNQDCLRSAVTQFKLNWDGILAELRELRNPKRTIVRTMDIYNPYVAEDQATNSWLDPAPDPNDFYVMKFYLDQVNIYIAQTAATDGIPCAPVYATFNGPNGDEDPKSKGYIAFDNFHPNDLGHTVIAGLFRKLGYEPLID